MSSETNSMTLAKLPKNVQHSILSFLDPQVTAQIHNKALHRQLWREMWRKHKFSSRISDPRQRNSSQEDEPEVGVDCSEDTQPHKKRKATQDEEGLSEKTFVGELLLQTAPPNGEDDEDDVYNIERAIYAVRFAPLWAGDSCSLGILRIGGCLWEYTDQSDEKYLPKTTYSWLDGMDAVNEEVALLFDCVAEKRLSDEPVEVDFEMAFSKRYTMEEMTDPMGLTTFGDTFGRDLTDLQDRMSALLRTTQEMTACKVEQEVVLHCGGTGAITVCATCYWLVVQDWNGKGFRLVVLDQWDEPEQL